MSITSKPKDFSVLFLDMNSFFASVEQQVQPSLRGKPVGVAPYVGNSGCIIAASYEAKQKGVKIARVGDAKKLCPDIKIVEARPALYMIYHKEIRKVLEKFTPYFEALSIDEFAIHLTAQDQNEASAVALAKKIKAEILAVGDYLRCSVGIGPSIFLAKMAAERQKPDGLTVVKLGDLRQFYEPLGLTELTGINFRLEAQLNIYGIRKTSEFYQKNLGELTAILKHWGRLWYFRLRGYEVDTRSSGAKTIGHSHVLAPEVRTKEAAISIIHKLVFKAGYRLRKENYLAHGVSISIHFLAGESWHLGRKFSAFYDNQSFLSNVYELLKSCSWRGRPIFVAVSAFDLQKKGSEQMAIFDTIEKSKKLSEALDKINDEYGAETIYQGSMFGSKDSAPDRIPFGRPRYDIRSE
jgi:DNA polymerase-4